MSNQFIKTLFNCLDKYFGIDDKKENKYPQEYSTSLEDFPRKNLDDKQRINYEHALFDSPINYCFSLLAL